MLKRYLTIIFVAVMAICMGLAVLTGCSGKNPDNGVPEYEYTSHTVFADEHDSDMRIDGLMSEDNWKNCKTYRNFVNGVGFEMTTYMTQKGLYVGMIAYDKDIWHGQPYVFEKNTNFLLRICGEDVDNLHPAYNKQFQFDAKHMKSRQMARVSSAVHIDGDGLNTSNNKSFSAEMFVSWKALNIETSGFEDGIPDCVKIYPIYTHVEGDPVKNTFSAVPGFGSVSKPSMYFRFGKNGYLNADGEGATVGDAANGYGKSNGWDLSGIEQGVVRTVSDNWQYMFFKNKASASYIFETTVRPVGGINDEYPNVGVLAGFQDVRKYRTLFFSAREQNLNANRVVFTNLTSYPNGWDQTQTTYEQVLPANEPNIRDGVRLKVVKSGGLFQYFINGRFMYSEYLDYLADECYAGFYSLGCETVYSDYSFTDYTGKEDELKEIVNDINFLLTSKKTAGGEVLLNKDFVGTNDGSVTLNIKPMSGFMLTDLKQNDVSIYDFVKENIQNGFVVVDGIDRDTVFEAEFAKMNTNLATFKGKVTEKPGDAAVAAVKVSAVYGNGLMNVVSFTSSKGEYALAIPKQGSYELNGKSFAISGNYEVVYSLSNDAMQYDEERVSILANIDEIIKDVQIQKAKTFRYPNVGKTYSLPGQNAKTVSFPQWKFDGANNVLTHSMAMPYGQYDRNYFTSFAYENYVIGTKTNTAGKTGAYAGIIVTNNENDLDFHAGIMAGNNGDGTYDVVLAQFRPWIDRHSGVFVIQAGIPYQPGKDGEVKLEVAKKDGVLYIFADDRFVDKIDGDHRLYEKFKINGIAENVLTGVTGAGLCIAPLGDGFTGTLSGVKFTDYYFSFDPGKIDDKVLAKTVEVSVIGGNGTASSSVQSVMYGGSAEITVRGDDGYVVDTITVNGTPADVNDVVDGVYTLCNITAKLRVEVTFKQGIQYPINVSVQGEGGSVSARPTNAYEGGNAEITVTLEDFTWRVAGITINGQPFDLAGIEDGKFTISNVTAEQNIIVTFEKVEHYEVSGKLILDERYAYDETNNANGVRLNSAVVTAERDGVTFRAEIDEQGDYTLRLPNGTYDITYSCAGFEAVTGSVTVAGENKTLEDVTVGTPIVGQTYTVADNVTGTTGNALWVRNSQGLTPGADFGENAYNRNFFALFHSQKALVETTVMTNGSANRYGGIVIVNKVGETQHQVGVFVKHNADGTYGIYLAQFFDWINGVSGLNKISGVGGVDYKTEGEVRLSLVQSDGALYIFTDGELRCIVNSSNQYYNRFAVPSKGLNMLNMANAFGLVVTRDSNDESTILAFKDYAYTSNAQLIEETLQTKMISATIGSSIQYAGQEKIETSFVWQKEERGYTTRDDVADGAFSRNFVSGFSADSYLIEATFDLNGVANRHTGFVIANNVYGTSYQIGIMLRHNGGTTYNISLCNYNPWSSSGRVGLAWDLPYSAGAGTTVKMTMIQKQGILYIYTDDVLRVTIDSSHEWKKEFLIKEKGEAELDALTQENALGVVTHSANAETATVTGRTYIRDVKCTSDSETIDAYMNR